MERLQSLFTSISASDGADIVLVSLAIFLGIKAVERSRSAAAMRGLTVALGGGLTLYLLSYAFELVATRWVMEKFAFLIAVMFLVVFQGELRKALAEIGRMPLFQTIFKQRTTAIEEIVVAAGRMSEKKIGALICIERRDPLTSYIESGIRVDAAISTELIRTVFAISTPLHDGATIVRNNRIAACGCLLPLTESDSLPRDLGTRHRAAVGLSEETDAVVIVCSEETGTISLVHDGRIERPETPDTLRVKLRALLEVAEEAEDGAL
jgi:diadenylate cyclase